MNDFDSWFAEQGKPANDDNEIDFTEKFECVCGSNSWSLSEIMSIWGSDDPQETLDYIDNEPLYMACNQRCIP